MINTLLGRLLLALCLLFFAAICWLLIVSNQSSQAFQHEVTQRLHLSLADHILSDTPIWEQDALDRAAIKHAFHTMMILGPAIELYVVNPYGEIIAYDAPEEKIKKSTIDLAPLKALMEGKTNLPIYGDDPRSEDKKKVFSVAPVFLDKSFKGYLYIILGGEQYDSLANNIKSNHIYRLAVTSVLVGLILLLIIGVVIFYVITRPLSQLSKQVSHYAQLLTRAKGSETTAKDIKQTQKEIDQLMGNINTHNKGEVALLQNSFHSMATKITEQMHHLTLTDEQRKLLLSHISHDLKTPIAAQRAYLDTLLVDLEEKTQQGKTSATLTREQKQQFLQSSINQCELLDKRVKEILELSRLEAGQFELNKEHIDITELASDVVQGLQGLAKQKDINLVLAPPLKSHTFTADASLINRLLINLIENALSHSPNNTKVTVSLRNKKGIITLNVQDQGKGIAKRDLPYIFDAFYRTKNAAEHNAQNKKLKGTTHHGLGLAICQRIAILHNTQVQVKSELNKGSVFSVGFEA